MYANISSKRTDNARSLRGHTISSETPSNGDLLQYNSSIDEYQLKNISEITHHSQHQNGGVDEINVAGLSGVLADPQTPVTHASRHQNGGNDEIDVTGLSGLLADVQKAGYIRSIDISSSSPTNGQILRYNSTFNRYEPSDIGVLPSGNLPDGVPGDMLFHNASEWVVLHVGAVGTILEIDDDNYPHFTDTIDGGSA